MYVAISPTDNSFLSTNLSASRTPRVNTGSGITGVSTSGSFGSTGFSVSGSVPSTKATFLTVLPAFSVTLASNVTLTLNSPVTLLNVTLMLLPSTSTFASLSDALTLSFTNSKPSGKLSVITTGFNKLSFTVFVALIV